MKFTLTTAYGKVGKAVVKTVSDMGKVSNKKVSASLSKPKVSGKVTDQTKSVKVYAKKGTTLYIKNGSKTLKKVKYTKSGYQTCKIEKQKTDTKLHFFVTNKSERSAYVVKNVVDVTPPEKPKAELNDEVLTVKGKPGTAVYVKLQSETDSATSWTYVGTLLSKKGNFQLRTYGSVQEGDFYRVKLKDCAGNQSKSVKVQIEYEPGMASSTM